MTKVPTGKLKAPHTRGESSTPKSAGTWGGRDASRPARAVGDHEVGSHGSVDNGHGTVIGTAVGAKRHDVVGNHAFGVGGFGVRNAEGTTSAKALTEVEGADGIVGYGLAPGNRQQHRRGAGDEKRGERHAHCGEAHNGKGCGGEVGHGEEMSGQASAELSEEDVGVSGGRKRERRKASGKTQPARYTGARRRVETQRATQHKSGAQKGTQPRTRRARAAPRNNVSACNGWPCASSAVHGAARAHAPLSERAVEAQIRPTRRPRARRFCAPRAALAT
ncbi:hypothetical protein FGB62_40g147 [Gracilaria domingensis]|nr:hypothetical protein FGB62_40g147 [Gracilaria domingensis]